MVAIPSFLCGIIALACCQSLVSSFEFKAFQHIHPRDPTHGDAETEAGLFSRKSFLAKSAQIALMPTSFVVSPEHANAAAPITEKETDSLGVLAKRALRPKPPKLLRRKLSQDFAVLLMRSSYDALDQLDCVAMDQFQRDFFLIRRSEYEPYIKALGPGLVQQGDLTDPYYFDFISLAQYETINREISQNPPLVFEEQRPIDQGEDRPQKFVPVVIKRDPSLTNDRLAPVHNKMVGRAILDRLEEIFGDTKSAIPKIEPGSRPDGEIILATVRQLVNIFLINGYAMGGSVSMSKENGTKIVISLNSPATLWGGKILQSERAKLNNNFLLKAAMELVNRAGYYSASSSIKYDGTSEEITITI